jgi:hypothetical protein
MRVPELWSSIKFFTYLAKCLHVKISDLYLQFFTVSVVVAITHGAVVNRGKKGFRMHTNAFLL